jgi:hypothetical protein
MIEAFKHFVKAVDVFGDQYLRPPNDDDTRKLLASNERRGWSGMLGCVDCMHWRWKNYPTGWKGYYEGHVDGPTMILEAVASQDLWIWHSFFGLPGSLNDINVLQRSPLFQRLKNRTSPPIKYFVNGNKYTMGYYLAWADLRVFPRIPGNTQLFWETFKYICVYTYVYICKM